MPPIDPLELDHPPVAPASTMPTDQQHGTSAQKLQYTRFMLIGAGVVVVVLLITTLVYASKASKTQEEMTAQYSAGLEAGKAQQKKDDTAAANQEAVSSTRTYTAPVTDGSFVMTFPKAWNISVDSNSSTPVAGLIDPGHVQLTSNEHALRFSLIATPYETLLKRYDDMTKKGVKKVDITVSGIKGEQYIGKINEQSKDAVGTVTIVPLRDKTFLMQTDSNKEYADAYSQLVQTAKLIP